MNIQAILADKWVRIGGGILAVIFAVSFLPAIFGWIPDGGLIFFNIVLALVFFNVVVQRHPIMSLRWLYGIDLGMGLLLMGATSLIENSVLAGGIVVMGVIPFIIWTGYQFFREMKRTSSLQGKFLPVNEDGLTLEFTDDGNLILSNGRFYRYVAHRNDLLLYDGDKLATKWEIAKCDLKTLMVKDDQGKLHEYKRDLTAVKSSGLGAVWNAVKYSQEIARLQAKWTAQGGSSPSIEFTGDGAFVRSDGKAGKYTVDWDSKTISVTLTDKTPLVFEIVSLSPTQLVLSNNGVATTYTTSTGKRLGFGGGQASPTSSKDSESASGAKGVLGGLFSYFLYWKCPKCKQRAGKTVRSGREGGIEQRIETRDVEAYAGDYRRSARKQVVVNYWIQRSDVKCTSCGHEWSERVAKDAVA